ncbi:MAG: sulfite exporter TauE/SafE family protein [Pseudomonadota bacterium]
MVEALALETWALLLSLTFVSGIIYGFAGFGAALVYLPIATMFLPPALVIAAFSISAMASLFTVVPQAWREADRHATFTLICAAVISAPLGIYGLKTLETEVIRYIVSAVVSITLVALIAGIKFTPKPGRPTLIGLGASAGVLGGLVGLMGPIVVLFQLGTGQDVARIRANTLCFLTIGSLLLLPLMWMQGIFAPAAIPLGLSMMVPYALGTFVGRRMFNPDRATLYKRCAYALIGLSALVGLPLFD